jgi:hypothetical protein
LERIGRFGEKTPKYSAREPSRSPEKALFSRRFGWSPGALTRFG